jgi:tetratricopeptide (TPR) repeat protein
VRRSRFPAAFAAALVLTALPASVAGQRVGSRQPILDSYAAIVNRYRAGEIETAVSELVSRDESWIDEATAALSLADWPTVNVQAALLLHVEATLNLQTRYRDQQRHLRAMWRILDFGRGTRLPMDFQRRAVLLVAWSLQSALRLDDLAAQIDRIAIRFPNDAEVLLALGSFYEVVAWSREPALNLAVASTGLSGTPAERRPRVLELLEGRDQRRIQEEAVVVLRRALGADPDLDEARLRLGRLLNELGRVDEALDTLRSRGGRADARFRYLNAMFEGAALQNGGRFEAAADAYRAAVALNPRCQTPWLALSAVLRDLGERESATETLERVAAAGAQCDDPWWSYRFGQAWRLDATLAELRQEVVP